MAEIKRLCFGGPSHGLVLTIDPIHYQTYFLDVKVFGVQYYFQRVAVDNHAVLKSGIYCFFAFDKDKANLSDQLISLLIENNLSPDVS
jgi:hypothetical protein